MKTKVTVPLLVVCLLLLPILVVAAVYYDWWGAVTGRSGSGDGRIIVNSPSVYTRQRLVNDRLTQNTWLQALLDVTDVTKGGLSTFRAIDAIRHNYEALDTNIAFSSKIGKDSGSEAKAKKEATPEAESAPSHNGQNSAKPDSEKVPSTDSYQIEPTTADLFRAMNTYREEVRSEMMQTQLDDRHDILGNTIYRLAIDVTVLAGREAGKLALVSVVLHYDPSDYPDDYKVVYDDWLRYIQRIANDSVDGLAKSLIARSLDPRVRVAVPYFIASALCKSIEAAATGPGSQIEGHCNMWSSERMPSVDLTWSILDRYVAQYLEYRAGIVRARFERDLRTATIARGLKPEVFPYAYDFASRDCNRNPSIQQTSIPGIGGQDISVNCPLFTLPDEGLVAGLTLYDFLVTHPSALADLIKDPQNASDPNVFARKLLTASVASNCNAEFRTVCIVPDLTTAQFGCIAAEYIVWSLNALGDPRAREDQRIRTFLDLKPVGRQFQNCGLMVTALSGPVGEMHESGDPYPDLAAKNLSRSLSVSNEVYAYSVTPKNLSERVSTTTDIRDAIQLLLSAKASMAVADATSMSNLIRKRAEDVQAVQQHAIVVGFGQSRGEGSPKPPYETSFGWALGPHLMGADGAQAQVDEQYGLAALISVPSWWRSVKLEIQTCWKNRKDLPQPIEKPEDVCIGGSTVQKHADIVRLPGVASDISRKLGFDIIQEPHLNPIQERQILQVGYPGDILLAGGRLWRSTAVTLGSQQANSINVLPDMEGIVAHFDCVRPQFNWGGKRSGEPFPVPVTVWTSEGKAEITDDITVRVEVPDDFWSTASNRDRCNPKSVAEPKGAAQALPGQAAPQPSPVSPGPTAQPIAAAQAPQSTESGVPQLPAGTPSGQAAPQPSPMSPGPTAQPKAAAEAPQSTESGIPRLPTGTVPGQAAAQPSPVSPGATTRPGKK